MVTNNTNNDYKKTSFEKVNDFLFSPIGTGLRWGLSSGLIFAPAVSSFGNDNVVDKNTSAIETTYETKSIEQMVAEGNIADPFGVAQDTTKQDTTKNTRAAFNLMKFGAPQFEFERTGIDVKQELSTAKIDSAKILAEQYNQLMQKFEDYIEQVRLDLGPQEIEQVRANRDSALFIYTDAQGVKSDIDRLMKEAMIIMDDIPKTSIKNQNNFIKSIDDALAGRGLVYGREEAKPEKEEEKEKSNFFNFDQFSIQPGYSLVFLNSDVFGNTKSYATLGAGLANNKGTKLMIGVLYNAGKNDSQTNLDTALVGTGTNGLPEGMELRAIETQKSDIDPTLGAYIGVMQQLHKNFAVGAGYMFLKFNKTNAITEKTIIDYPAISGFVPQTELDVNNISYDSKAHFVDVNITGIIPINDKFNIYVTGKGLYDVVNDNFKPAAEVKLNVNF